MNSKTLRQRKYKEEIAKLYVKYPQAKSVKQRYKVLRVILCREWQSLNKLSSQIEPKVLEEILKDAIHLDRLIRRMTEDTEQEEKEILSQDYQLNQLPTL